MPNGRTRRIHTPRIQQPTPQPHTGRSRSRHDSIIKPRRTPHSNKPPARKLHTTPEPTTPKPAPTRITNRTRTRLLRRRSRIRITTTTTPALQHLSDSYRTGAAIKQGIPVAIIGATNAGKSSLLNTLVGDQRAIVSDIHGTTRDIVEDSAEIGDYLFRFLDTAGLRHTTDTIEQIGIERSRQAAHSARIILLVADATTSPDPQAIDTTRNSPDAHIILVANKTDLPLADTTTLLHTARELSAPLVSISAATGAGIDNLRQALVSAIESEGDTGSELLVTNARQAQALQRAADSTARVISGLETGLSGDFIAQDLRQTMHYLSEVSGEITTPDILQNIFTRFCIGK